MCQTQPKKSNGTAYTKEQSLESTGSNLTWKLWTTTNPSNTLKEKINIQEVPLDTKYDKYNLDQEVVKLANLSTEEKQTVNHPDKSQCF